MVAMQLHVDVVLVPGFPLSELAAVQEVVESLKHPQEHSDIVLTFYSPEGGDVEAADARHGRTTLLSVPLMLNRKEYRAWILKHCRNRAVIDFFSYEFAVWNQRQIAEFVQPILNKVDQFLLSDTVRIHSCR